MWVCARKSMFCKGAATPGLNKVGEIMIKAVVGGTQNSVAMISHAQGWLHCDIPNTDASGVVKSMMGEFIDELRNTNMLNRVHITTSCCQINCGGQGDIAINVQHTKPPRINHDLVANVCERSTVVARCSVAAIRQAMGNGKPSLEVDERKCICCGACYPPYSPMQVNDPEHSKLAIWVSGNHSNARGKPSFQKLVAAGIPNNPPRWPEATDIHVSSEIIAQDPSVTGRRRYTIVPMLN